MLTSFSRPRLKAVSWRIIECLTRVIRRLSVGNLEQELPTLPQHLSSSQLLVWFILFLLSNCMSSRKNNSCVLWCWRRFSPKTMSNSFARDSCGFFLFVFIYIFWSLARLPDHMIWVSVLWLSGVRTALSLFLCVLFLNHYLSFFSFLRGHCVVCRSSIYGLWYTPFSILKTFLKHTLINRCNIFTGCCRM